MAKKSLKDFRQRAPEELPQLLLEKCEELFRYRMQHKTGRLAQTHLLKVTRREIACLKTLIAEHRRRQQQG